MDLDLETFLTAFYVIVDDLYQSDISPRMPACGGPAAQMSDSEVPLGRFCWLDRARFSLPVSCLMCWNPAEPLC
jgi:hypothetical protein